MFRWREWFIGCGKHAAKRPGGAFALVLGVIIILELTLALTHSVNDPTNDRERPASFKVMPLVPYSPIESTRDQFRVAVVETFVRHGFDRPGYRRADAARRAYLALDRFSSPRASRCWWARHWAGWPAIIEAGSTSGSAGLSRSWTAFRLCCSSWSWSDFFDSQKQHVLHHGGDRPDELDWFWPDWCAVNFLRLGSQPFSTSGPRAGRE